VFTTDVIVEPLTDYIWAGFQPSVETQTLRIAQFLYAFNNAIESLDKFYTSVEVTADERVKVARFFPYIRSYPHVDNQVTFDYIEPLTESRKAIFKAKLRTNGKLIVVKFVERYNSAAHRLLAARGLAPELLYAETDEPRLAKTPNRLYMIVMGFVEGENAWERYGDRHLPGDVVKQVEGSVAHLHANKWVFGDLRATNVMIENQRDGSQKVLLIDFDWCGVAGESKYPVTVNCSDINRHPEVQRGGLMDTKHDLYMLELWKKILVK
ncbi:hypothetical protein BD410DRAFT_889015, partial [Rickenella mellea]